MNGRGKQTDCRQQSDNTWLLPPLGTHKEQQMPQIAQKDLGFCNRLTANLNSRICYPMLFETIEFCYDKTKKRDGFDVYY